MTEQQISEFMQQTGSDRHMAVRYLGKANYDVSKAIREYYGGRPPPQRNVGNGVEWFGGDSTAILSKETPLGEGSSGSNPVSGSSVGTTVHGGTSSSSDVKPIVLPNTDYSIPGQPKTRVRIEFDNDFQVPPITLTVSMSQTIGDVRSFIIANRPTLQDVPFHLVQKPSTPLDDDSLTIEAGKLKMAMIKVIH